ncbi:MAG: hypothetical protein HY323_19565 [Betaproteobacteria bacterium]|nr:hypothetical protein [Betaproteobacteria bacterium]
MFTGSEDDAPQFHNLLGSSEYEAAVDESIARAQWSVRIFDRRLGSRYNSPLRYDLLQHFLRLHRANRLYIVLHDTANLQRDCPRLVTLLRQFSHAVRINKTLKIARHVYDPFVIIDENHYVHRFHYEHLRAEQALNDLAGTKLLLQRFDELWEASAPSVSATTIGL